MIVRNPASRASFRSDKMGKSDLASGEQLFAGLNAFEPGQQHAMHAHPGQDKVYVVLEGEGEATVADETSPVGPGDFVFAAADVPHAMANTGSERLVVMAILAPPPGKK